MGFKIPHKVASLVFCMAVFGCSQFVSNVTHDQWSAPKGSSAIVSNVIVYRQPGRFCGWPANNGVWHWGNEILVAFNLGYFLEPDPNVDATEHHFDRSKGTRVVMARSKNGGISWHLEQPANLNKESKPIPCPGGINFADPDFAMRIRADRFNVSFDRGKTWSVPYLIPKIGPRPGGRTDYIVNGPSDCMFFLTEGSRPYCARTLDGGKTIHFVSWMAPKPIVYTIMPSTVRVSQNQLVSVMRQSRGEAFRGWIDVFGSVDNGQTWEFVNKCTYTDDRDWNGNPPSMVRLRDGRLCVTYGYRWLAFGIRARLSSDNGKTWSDEIILRSDGLNWDMGYTRTIERSDGKLVTIYYFATAEKPEHCIAATIWDPGKIQ